MPSSRVSSVTTSPTSDGAVEAIVDEQIDGDAHRRRRVAGATDERELTEHDEVGDQALDRREVLETRRAGSCRGLRTSCTASGMVAVTTAAMSMTTSAMRPPVSSPTRATGSSDSTSIVASAPSARAAVEAGRRRPRVPVTITCRRAGGARRDEAREPLMAGTLHHDRVAELHAGARAPSSTAFASGSNIVSSAAATSSGTRCRFVRGSSAMRSRVAAPAARSVVERRACSRRRASPCSRGRPTGTPRTRRTARSRRRTTRSPSARPHAARRLRRDRLDAPDDLVTGNDRELLTGDANTSVELCEVAPAEPDGLDAQHRAAGGRLG